MQQPTGAPADRLTAARLPALESDALPSFLDQHSTGRSTAPKRRSLSRKERRERTSAAEIQTLVENLTRVANPMSYTSDLRRAVEVRLDRTHHEDLLILLKNRMPYEAQNIVLERLPGAARSDDAAGDLLCRLLDIGFEIAPAPEEESLADLHGHRVARMVCWFFQWLVEPRAEAHAAAIAHYLRTLASDEKDTARLILEELLIHARHDRIPELPKAAWLAVVRALYERSSTPHTMPGM
ncbi:hypothetical protein QFZ75_002088 [Streptomyces sp. V3I8]|uniref:hypothetical protein n=1 Tax=Streptomyces sp. V3I8 TaxID=3042279 RepID=UPI00277FC988|nr:hypothetical protein [Streptomyces sp. V3I8]MDQ1035672.1 hypothetical protein [Streptomyces sp. V3I8]